MAFAPFSQENKHTDAMIIIPRNSFNVIVASDSLRAPLMK
ncbi:hypothetical protein PROSTU_02126 [Providencia stuartii ATCC 25827]|uniref:Uncharacterized protein n=1 Tax=Providencia stuartii ATCC 25827 TaxID=471874 RepID=A0AA86YIE5_PROST|nr:hypothetical protein PROSTU_02126 [Providencia stuartii ATCC 25827]